MTGGAAIVTFRDLHSAPIRAMVALLALMPTLHPGAKSMAILPNLAQENEALKAQIAEMQAKLASASAPKAITLKVSEKGALSVYGLGRFPVTLYRGQWERLFAAKAQVEAFMQANTALLATKPAT